LTLEGAAAKLEVLRDSIKKENMENFIAAKPKN
jgi:hypothetical protein